MTTKPTTEAVEAIFGAFKKAEQWCSAEMHSEKLVEYLKDEGFTIAPIAPVTDEKLREAVDAIEKTSRRATDCGYSWPVIKDALSELAHRRAEQTWQPIETAPKDGTKVLLGRFVLNCPEGKNGRMAVDFWHTVNPHGYEGWGKFNTRYWPATHWMPLPTPPKED